MSAAEIQHIGIAPASFTEAAARDIVNRHRAALPDLRDVVLVVPDLHAASDVARALRVAAARPVLLLPRITTLRQWAAQIALDKPLQPRALREATLYGALAGHASLGDADRWAVASELLALFDELTRHAVTLPQSAAEFARQLEHAYRARQNRSLEFEATLVHELWRLMAQDARELDPEAAYPLRLSHIAAHAREALYVLGLRRLAPSERRFLQTYAQRAPVLMFDAKADAGDALDATLGAAWPIQTQPAARETGLRERARALHAAFPVSALTARVGLFGAGDAEQEARAVDVQVRDWLLAGKQRIAVVALDRVIARRARALLERAGVLVRDESGWPMATTSAATVISRFLDVAAGDAWHRDLLDLMKSPFAFHDWPRESRQQAVWRFEQMVREASVISGIGSFIALAERRNDGEVRQLLVRVQRGVTALGRQRRPLARWLAALRASLDEIGVSGGLAADTAGMQVFDFIDNFENELARDRLAVPFTEWRRWLARQLESASFIERAVDSPVVFTHLAATPLRAFDAVLVLGCDARHLSAANEAPMFFNQSVRAQLGLPTSEDEARETESQLAALIAATPTVLLTWQKLAGGEANLLAPPIERLLALHRSAYGTSLEETRLAALIAHSQLRADDEALPAALPLPPAPRTPSALLPEAISASGYNTLLACPYQFHARYLLRLAQVDEVQELIEKSDYGLRVHAVLQTFHAAHSQASAMPESSAIAELERLSDAAFRDDVARNYLARGWLLRWKALIPAYVRWQRERECAGWHWHVGEVERRVAITTPAGRRFTLLGRIDRVDRQADGAVAVIDYKTRDPKRLADALTPPGEDVQLPVYALLWGGPVAAALFLSIERDGVAAVPMEDDLAQLARDAQTRLAELYDAMSNGQTLPAQGAPQVCQYCDAQGLCRRAHW